MAAGFSYLNSILSPFPAAVVNAILLHTLLSKAARKTTKKIQKKRKTKARSWRSSLKQIAAS